MNGARLDEAPKRFIELMKTRITELYRDLFGTAFWKRKDHKLIIIRGNSGSGKTTVARELHKLFGRGTMLISQDVVRFEMLNVKDGKHPPAAPLLKKLLRYGKKHSRIVILEGILNGNFYRSLLKLAVRLYGSNIYAYYYDLPFEETLRRHQTKPNSQTFGEKEMRKWWKEKDYVDFLNETTITKEKDMETTVREIFRDVTGKEP